MKSFFSVSFPADTRFIKTETELTINIAKLAGFKEKEARDMALAVDEAVTNTIKHAYKYNKTKTVELNYTITEKSLEISVLHTGEPLAVDNINLPDMGEYLKEYRKGGLGIMLMVKIMDKVEYGNFKGKHFCKLIKYKK